MKRQLLCTFTVNDSLSLTLDYLETYFKISNSKVYLYREEENPSNLILVYNIEENLRDGLAKNTILVHRKKHSNTVYTINALNSLITRVNNGVLDKSYQVNWDNYKDTLLIIKDNDLVLVNLQFSKVIYLQGD
jgi:hypothetical protein